LIEMRKLLAEAPLRIRRLRRADLPTDTIQLSKFLIGKMLVHDLPRVRVAGRIVETEAYPVGDKAAHAYGGLTPSRRSLFLSHGHAYVYFTYGSCFMMNVSSEIEGTGAGVLIRAVEPIEGIAFMQRRRGTTRILDLARGPGRLAQAMDIDKRRDGLHLCDGGPLWLGGEVRPSAPIGVSIRIGITRDVDRLFRFYERGSPYVSGPGKMRV
jgi:DNA-3-methyladenine glycosylase